MMTAVPALTLNGWEGLVTFDAGFGAGFFSNYNFGVQDFGGPVQIVATSGIRVNPFSHAYTGFRVQHFSDAGLFGSSSLGVDMYLENLDTGFNQDVAGLAISSHGNNQAQPFALRLPP